ncbi:MAG: 50S ribosomal protein L25 [endosymbiont of Galathealinum brachiosum]|uniref:Large ribosomal subunit protein bL25 n=1 Tax=endosymbiont of Galathealinum brachiosum TaxID=2200906 RepID=A0A370DB74_9GAMM|nr:MAG: 50S ribosomal protein L25 [endosymbiont of Galathealinum brachiosum]
MAITINAETRTDLGKGASRRLRLEEKIPAIVYGSGDPKSLTIDLREVRPHVNEEVFYASIVALKVDGKKTAEKVIVRDIQHHPFKVDIMHIDFQRVDAKKKMHMHVQLHFTGEDVSPGVKSGGQVSHVVNEVEVICLAKDIPEFIEVDISALETGESIHLTELNIPKGVELAALTHGDENHDTAVVSIHTPKVVVEEEDEAPAAAAEDDATEE